MNMIKKLSALLLCLCLALCAHPAQAQEDMVFTFFQIESMKTDSIGDCCLIQFPDGQTMLVDALLPECAPHLVSKLKALGIERIDYLLITHMHIDHIGGMAAIIQNFDVGHLLGPGVPYSTDTYHEYAAMRDLKGLSEEKLERGDTFSIGDVQIEVLNPLIDDALYQQFQDDTLTVAQTNQHSIVFKLTYGDFSALFTGDIYQERERDLNKLYGDALRSTLLKISHHGSDSSGYKLFVKAVQAQYAVAMGNTGMQTWLYDRYRQDGACKVYLTLLDGTVTIHAQKDNTVTVDCEWTRSAPGYPL